VLVGAKIVFISLPFDHLLSRLKLSDKNYFHEFNLFILNYFLYLFGYTVVKYCVKGRENMSESARCFQSAKDECLVERAALRAHFSFILFLFAPVRAANILHCARPFFVCFYFFRAQS
jgi:hypothetical protein